MVSNPSGTLRLLLAGLTAALLTACGGGGSAGAADSAPAAAATGDSGAPANVLSAAEAAAASAAATEAANQALAAGDRYTADALLAAAAKVPADRPANLQEAARFLTQASFGPTPADNELLMKLGYAGWVNYQFGLPATSHRADWEAADAAIKAVTPTAAAGQDQVWESFWKQATTGRDQLRQRTAYALSQIFVISAVDGGVGNEPRALAAWLDMLGDKGLGTYRELLENVSLHPLMGLYLTSLHNQKADAASGRVPDENYAREVMQLFSIGLTKLNADGTPALVGGQPVETYGPTDITGMARVFTGWSWACGASNSACFNNGSTGGVADPDRAIKPMMAYPQYHSTEAKTFLGVTIPAQTTANPAASLKVALDTLANHANTAPFISKQLIQRLVSSNPSPAYVRDVAAVFANNGSGVRGDLKAVVKAILTHPEARLRTTTTGKLREPVLRLSAYLRAFPHTSDTGNFKVGNTDNASTSLGQTPLRAGSVFNFYRPGYVAPGTKSAAAGLVAPELQLQNESSAAGWVNFMRDNLSQGVGQTNGTVNGVVLNRRDLRRDWTAEMTLASNSSDLVASVTDRLLYGQASTALTTAMVTAINKITIPALNAAGTNQAAIETARRNRVYAAVLLTLASPEFLVQK
jgi:uncharacterized protein (DUF1800 family)